MTLTPALAARRVAGTGNGRPAPARPLLSVVIPAHNESGAIGSTLERLAAVAGRLSGAVEVIVVSDGSVDATTDVASDALRRCALTGRVVELAINAGSHAAIRCGFGYANGEYVAIMAADGQDPPEAIPEMLDRFGPRLDVVWGRRGFRGDSVTTRLAAVCFYRLFRLVTGVDYPPAGLDFLVARRRVIDAVLRRSTRNASLFLVIYNLGFAQGFADYDRGARVGGRSSWTLQKRLKLAGDMLTGCSAAPIRIVSLAGVAVGLVGTAVGAATLARALVSGADVPGWTALLTLNSVMGALLFGAVALLGEYVWRVLDEVRGAPPFIEAHQERVGGERR